MSRFPGLSRAELETFLRAFTQPGTLVEVVAKDLGVSLQEFND